MVKYYPFAVSVQGYAHKKKESLPENSSKNRTFPCQDSSYSNFVEHDYSHKTDFHLCCACDGHGGAAYFRSGKGSQFAVSAITETLIKNIDKISLSATDEDINNSILVIINDFVTLWEEKVNTDLTQYPVTENEFHILKEENPEAAKKYIAGEDLTSIYGTTAIIFFKTETLWVALQIGDGDIFIQDDDGKFIKPLLDDPNNFLNQTTSLCDINAKEEFRIAFGKKIPKAVFCSTDGLINSFSNENQLKNFYSKLIWIFKYYDFDNKNPEKLSIQQRVKNTIIELKNSLPDISMKGSGDDISIAGIITIDETTYERHVQSKNFIQKGKQYLLLRKISTAEKYFLDAAENGYPEGYFNLGKMELQKYKKTKNMIQIQKGIEYFSLAVTQGYTEAKKDLGILLYYSGLVSQNNKDFKNAISFFEQAIENENPDAMFALSLYYGRPQDYEGCGVKQNFVKAIKLTEMAAEFGIPEAECKMGKCYKDGRGVQKNEELSDFWYEKAAKHHNEEAIKYLKEKNGRK